MQYAVELSPEGEDLQRQQPVRAKWLSRTIFGEFRTLLNKCHESPFMNQSHSPAWYDGGPCNYCKDH